MSTEDEKAISNRVGKERVSQKARTRRLLIETAVMLIAAGKQPTVTEVADAGEVSRRTAYRYFPTKEKLHAEAALEGLRPEMQLAIEESSRGQHGGNVDARVDALVENMQRLAFKNESLLRTMIHQTVLGSGLNETPRRGTRRIDWIESAIQPLATKLTATAYKRLVCVLAVCTGMESIIVLRDICGLSADDTIAICQWLARTAIKQLLAEKKAAARRRNLQNA